MSMCIAIRSFQTIRRWLSGRKCLKTNYLAVHTPRDDRLNRCSTTLDVELTILNDNAGIQVLRLCVSYPFDGNHTGISDFES